MSEETYNLGKPKVDLKKLRELEEEGYIRSQVHPTLDLIIWNYTQTTQFEGFWNEETMMCRGLVTNTEGEIIARPFKKFFNHDEHKERFGETPKGRYEVYEKLDGSLGIAFNYKGENIICTRGSFTSDQAIKAKEILPKIKLKPNTTYLFEIIYPENRIVVNYGEKEELILLGIIDNKTWKTTSDTEVEAKFTKAKQFEYDLDKISQIQEENTIDNFEGFVLYFPETEERTKVKLGEYIRLHRILTGINSRHVWENLMNGDDMSTLIELVPDEFYKWVEETKEEITSKYKKVKKEYVNTYKSLNLLLTRPELAVIILKKYRKYQQLLFNKLKLEQLKAEIPNYDKVLKKCKRLCKKLNFTLPKGDLIKEIKSNYKEEEISILMSLVNEHLLLWEKVKPEIAEPFGNF